MIHVSIVFELPCQCGIVHMSPEHESHLQVGLMLQGAETIQQMI